MAHKKYLAFGIVCASLIFASAASAHVVVRPDTAGIGAFQTFTMGVPTEKDEPTVAVSLMIPEGVMNVSPNVKPGWKIEVKKNGNAATEIDWTAGSIPAGERDDFVFSAQVPATPTVLAWKAYQTYKDGSVVSWDADPSAIQPTDASGKVDFSKVGPYSRTTVVNDLNPVPQVSWWQENGAKVSISLSVIALLFAAYALVRKTSA